MTASLFRPGRAGWLGTWGPTAVYAVLILILATQPLPRLPRISHVDKYLHMASYGFLTVLAFRSFRRSGAPYAAWWAVVFAVIIGSADEGVQAIGGRRTPDRYDLLADGVGAVLAMIALKAGALLLLQRRKIDNSRER
jgi:VanZ family protein